MLHGCKPDGRVRGGRECGQDSRLLHSLYSADPLEISNNSVAVEATVFKPDRQWNNPRIPKERILRKQSSQRGWQKWKKGPVDIAVTVVAYDRERARDLTRRTVQKLLEMPGLDENKLPLICRSALKDAPAAPLVRKAAQGAKAVTAEVRRA
jgi:hypothetical protein